LAATCKTANNSTRTTSATVHTATVNTWYRVVITLNSDATQVTCEVFNDSGTSQGSQSNTTNIPTASGRETGHGFIYTNSGTTAVLGFYLDWMAVWYQEPLTR
jgi:hypothetical protein